MNAKSTRNQSANRAGIRRASKTYNCAGCGLPIRAGTEYLILAGGLKGHLGVKEIGSRGMGCPHA